MEEIKYIYNNYRVESLETGWTVLSEKEDILETAAYMEKTINKYRKVLEDTLNKINDIGSYIIEMSKLIESDIEKLTETELSEELYIINSAANKKLNIEAELTGEGEIHGDILVFFRWYLIINGIEITIYLINNK